ncbi:tetratricopeptide repeat protein [Sphaerospermopsis torques-reginae]|uniref:Tetratricopeptide repeat protein n=1 Tax=Sphaerospermopsis torques-reginae ITEP-024 TaxID=984208 RepID=A0ABX8X026_9CYAN|nr:tetratricopeptide repeat protein [Sphaerospermopsis torques-reginae]QYX32014.1 tetratricopeptide repeat protein [Sphaerospermopsis torques-reginae ITEP-024]
MLEEVIAAFERKDYQTAVTLIKPLLKQSPEDPWVQFYFARLQEVYEKRQEAEKIYRQLLKVTINNKIISQARQGIQRIKDFEQTERQKAIAQAIAEPSNNEPGILVLEPINNQLKTLAAPKFAQIMQIDTYSARLMLPSRSWRVYRTGKIGEMQFYGKQLQQAGIPCFWLKISQIQQIQVHQVQYFSESSPNPKVVCVSSENQLGSLSFDWSEVTAKVVGLLPIFEQVVDINVRGKLERKTQTQDYYQFCDLHLPERRSILRIYDNGYEFQKGLEITPQATQNTIRINWNSLMSWVEQKIPQVKTSSDFQPFGETVLDQTEVLNQIPSHIQLFRRENTNWDAAFQLYSGIVFVKNCSSN